MHSRQLEPGGLLHNIFLRKYQICTDRLSYLSTRKEPEITHAKTSFGRVINSNGTAAVTVSYDHSTRDGLNKFILSGHAPGHRINQTEEEFYEEYQKFALPISDIAELHNKNTLWFLFSDDDILVMFTDIGKYIHAVNELSDPHASAPPEEDMRLLSELYSFLKAILGNKEHPYYQLRHGRRRAGSMRQRMLSSNINRSLADRVDRNVEREKNHEPTFDDEISSMLGTFGGRR